VDTEAIRKWREDVGKGKVVGKAPASCQACLARKRLCSLPATAAMQEAMKKRQREMKGLAEDEGAEQKAKRAKRKVKKDAGEGRKALEASRSRLEPAEEVVDAEEARGCEPEAGGSEPEFQARTLRRAIGGQKRRTHGVVINNHNFRNCSEEVGRPQ